MTHAGAAGAAASGAPGLPPQAIGTPRLWHRFGLQFDGPSVDEGDATNPFTDYRMDVTFTAPSGATYTVPGHFAADGDAANTGASSGDQWRVWFNPNETGYWEYNVTFVTGTNVYLGGGTGTSFNGESGRFRILDTDKTGDDFRARGWLETPVGRGVTDEHWMSFAGTGLPFVKNGLGSPENFLGYYEFDQTSSQGGQSPSTTSNLHEYPTHESDWNSGDPTWDQLDGATGGAPYGKHIIGVVNYVASVGMNSIYIVAYSIDGGDAQDTWPWTSTGTKVRFDVSKLDQWDIVFHHMQTKGVCINYYLTERENNQGIGGTHGVEFEDELYYRELISRFGHHNAIIWDLGEEAIGDWTVAEIEAHADAFRAVEPYHRPLTVHNSGGKTDFEQLMTDGYLDGASVQDFGNNLTTNTDINDLWTHSETVPIGWWFSEDEIDDEGVPEDGQTTGAGESQADFRKVSLWGAFLAGGTVAWYMAPGDQSLEDIRTRSSFWPWTSHAVDFMESVGADLLNASPNNGLVAYGAGNAWCLEWASNLYLAYFDGTGSSPTIDLPGGTWDVEWWDPVNGGVESTDSGVSGGTDTSLTIPGTLDDAAAKITQA